MKAVSSNQPQTILSARRFILNLLRAVAVPAISFTPLMASAAFGSFSDIQSWLCSLQTFLIAVSGTAIVIAIICYAVKVFASSIQIERLGEIMFACVLIGAATGMGAFFAPSASSCGA